MLKLFSIILSALTMSGCTSAFTPATQAPGIYRKMEQSKAKEMLDNHEEVTLVDVRTPEEYMQQNIPGSILVPLDELETLAPERLPDKAATLLVYCRSGRRSESAARKLVAMGYTAVYDIGGIMSWPYETTAGTNGG